MTTPINDSLFLMILEGRGGNAEWPQLTSKEKITINCSNGDREIILLNLPYPQCLQTIGNTVLLFAGIPSRKHFLLKYNGYIDVQEDSVQVIAQYKSYWTGNIVSDTAYVSP